MKELSIYKNLDQDNIDLEHLGDLKELCLINQKEKKFIKLPKSLIRLNLNNNLKQYKTNYLVNLKILEMINNNIKELNITNPKLEYLNASENSIKDVKHLPESLIELKLSTNQITKIELPKNLLMINLTSNYLKSIPQMPKTIQTINLSYNLINKIENLEQLNVSNLNLSSNEIKKIENIRNTNLRVLNITQNEINEINNLPESLDTLLCSANKIKKLILNKNLKNIFCCDNQLVNLDLRGTNLHICNFNNNPIVQIRVNKQMKNFQFNNSKQTLKYILPIKNVFDITWNKNILLNSASLIITGFFIKIVYKIKKNKK